MSLRIERRIGCLAAGLMLLATGASAADNPQLPLKELGVS